jgi:CcmD family protein
MTSYLLAAYAIFWAGTFIYLLSLAARQRGLSRKVDSLAAMLDEVQGTEGLAGD